MQERKTQAQLLAGQERQIGLRGELKNELLQELRGAQERATIAATGTFWSGKTDRTIRGQEERRATGAERW